MRHHKETKSTRLRLNDFERLKYWQLLCCKLLCLLQQFFHIFVLTHDRLSVSDNPVSLHLK